MHCAKIKLADEVLVVTPGGCDFGESTQNEICCAETEEKPVFYTFLNAEKENRMKLTVIIRDDFCNDAPSHRSVQIELTKEQCDLIRPRKVGTDCGKDKYESISMPFIEPVEQEINDGSR